MTTTQERSAETTAQPAPSSAASSAAGWAVPGVDLPGGPAPVSPAAAPDAAALDAGGLAVDPDSSGAVPGAGAAGEVDAGLDARAATGPGACGLAADPDSSDAAPGPGGGAAEGRSVVGELGDLGAAGPGPDPGGPGGGHPVVVAVVACLEALETAREAGVGTLRPVEIRLLLLGLVQVIAAAFALKLRLLVAGETQRVQDLTGATSVAAFLAHLTQVRRADASAEVRLAKDLDRRFPLIADALARGLMAPEQVRVAVAALRRLPRKEMTPERWAAVQSCLVEAAQSMDPTQLKAVGRRLWEVIDPDGAEKRLGDELEDEEELARASAFVRFWRNGDGTTGFKGKLPDLQADMLLKAIQAFASPRRRSNPNIPTSQPDDHRHPHPEAEPEPESEPEPEPEPEPEHGSESEPAESGPAPAPSGTVSAVDAAGSGTAEGYDAEAERGTTDEAGGDPATGPGSTTGTTSDKAPPPDTAPPGAAPAEETDPPWRRPGWHPDGTGGRDDRDADDWSPEERDTGREIPYPVRLGHGLLELVERLPRDLLPASGGVAATIVVTMTLDQLRTGLGVCTLDTGTEVSAGQVRRLACEAGIIPVVLGGESEPLDVGRERRFHTKAQRIAMTVRDGGCVAEGCDRPAAWTQAHHLIPWEEGGHTTVAAGVLGCDYHHHLLHSTKWTATRLPNGKIRFRRITKSRD